MRRLLAATLVVLATGGCSFHAWGPDRPFKPEGETVVVEPAKGVTVTGEFIGIRNENLVLLRDGRLVEVPLAALKQVDVQGYSKIKIGDREKLLLYARYPQGLREEQWTQLLREHGQSSPDAVPLP